MEKYFSVTRKALKLAKSSGDRLKLKGVRDDYLDMITRYISDAEYFKKKKDFVNAFACLNYAHGWLDAGARIGIFDVYDSSLFTVDDEKV